MAGIHLGRRSDNGADCVIDVADLDYHAQIIGPTGTGKSRLLIHIFNQLALTTDSAAVLLDPTGGVYSFLKRWCYEEGLEDRVILIDPGEQRLICGFNPIRPWEDNRELQAMISLDLIRRSMDGDASSMATPRMARWLFNTLYGLIETGLTLHEATGFLDYNNSALRDAITSRLPLGPTRSDWEWLGGMISIGRQAQVMSLLDDQLGSSVNRVRFYVQNPYLRLMLGTTRAIDWKEVINRRKLVLVNLQQRSVLNGEHQRLLGMQIMNEVIREAFRREAGAEERVPCYLFADEFQEFAAPGLATILTTGRQFLLRLILAHHNLPQLLDVKNQDPKLYHAVLGSARTKIVFGGLDPSDADLLGRTLFGHHLDPDAIKHQIWSWTQLSHVERVESENWSAGTGRGRSIGRSNSLARGRSRGRTKTTASAYGISTGYGSGTSSGQSLSETAGNIYEPETEELLGTSDNETFLNACQTMESYSGGESYSDTESISDATTESEVWAEGEVESESETAVLSAGGTSSWMVMPGEPFEQLSSVQYRSLEEQLHSYVSEMVGQPDQHAIVAVRKGYPVAFQVARVDDPKFDDVQAREIDLEVMQAQPEYYSARDSLVEEIRERQKALLPAPARNDELTPRKRLVKVARRLLRPPAR